MSSQRSRLGYVTWFKTIKSFGSLGGMLIIRSIARAESAHIAMVSRGYDGGRVLTVQLTPLAGSDYAHVFIMWDYYWHLLSCLGFFW